MENQNNNEQKVDFNSDWLLENGWVKDEFPYYLKKKIENRNPLNDSPEDTDIELVVHGLYNTQTFAVLFPSGAMLNFVANSKEDLIKFESMIDFYDCEY
jgi:hypothetical protein